MLALPRPAGEGKALQREQPGAGVLDAELGGDVAQALVLAAVVQHEVVHADARFVHQRGLIVRVQLMTPFWNGAILKLLYRNGSGVDAGRILAAIRIAGAEVVLARRLSSPA